MPRNVLWFSFFNASQTAQVQTITRINICLINTTRKKEFFKIEVGVYCLFLVTEADLDIGGFYKTNNDFLSILILKSRKVCLLV